MGHDQIFKEFLRAFLKDFLELFFPKVEARLDFGDLRFLDTESFTSFPEGSSRAADIVAEVRRRNRAREILLVHGGSGGAKANLPEADVRVLHSFVDEAPGLDLPRRCVSAGRARHLGRREVRDKALRARAARFPVPGRGAGALRRPGVC
jgi:hypothetical protein